MKFRTICRLMYLKRARHRRGHGIHSPFLFRLITTVVENKRKLPEYEIYKNLKNDALGLLGNFPEPLLSIVYRQFNLPPMNPRRLYRKVELPLRYGKVVFRLIREFKPSVILCYGPTFGVNLAFMAMADAVSTVYQVINDRTYEWFSKELLKISNLSNIYFCYPNPPLKPAFFIINYPDDPHISRSIIQNIIENHGDDDVLVIRGIHESKEMQEIWQEMTGIESVRVSLDLFEMGIALFRKGLQKENFIHRF